MHTDKQAEQHRHQAYCASPPLKLAQAIGVRFALTIGYFLRMLRSTADMKRRWLLIRPACGLMDDSGK